MNSGDQSNAKAGSEEELREKIRKLNVYQAATNVLKREDLDEDTLKRFQANWELHIEQLIAQASAQAEIRGRIGEITRGKPKILIIGTVTKDTSDKWLLTGWSIDCQGTEVPTIYGDGDSALFCGYSIKELQRLQQLYGQVGE